jgi:hypothetical protein
MSLLWGEWVLPMPKLHELHYNAMCTCSVHCSNRCETQHCSGWCYCWCHAEEYADHARQVA